MASQTPFAGLVAERILEKFVSPKKRVFLPHIALKRAENPMLCMRDEKI
jgi:hypothetical protein